MFLQIWPKETWLPTIILYFNTLPLSHFCFTSTKAQQSLPMTTQSENRHAGRARPPWQGCSVGHDPALKAYDLSMWTTSMTVSLRPRQAATSDKKPFDTNTAGPHLYLLVPSILADINHDCHHCQRRRNRLCVCVGGREGVGVWGIESDRHCGCWLICCVPIFACSERLRQQEGVCSWTCTWVHTIVSCFSIRKWAKFL